MFLVGFLLWLGGVYVYRYKAKVTRVIDGDTIVANVDLGFYIHLHELDFRLVGINTPEMYGSEREEGLKVKEYLRLLIEGNDVEIETYKADSFGRWLCNVWYEGIHINQHLIEIGMAEIYRG
jgi:micrococcal nuclease